MERFRCAVLVKEFGLRPWEIAKLTDRQIDDFYFHPRDEHGALVAPVAPLTAADFGTRYEPPASLEDELKRLAELHSAVAGGKGKGLTNYASAVARIEALWVDGTRQKQRAVWEAEQKAATSQRPPEGTNSGRRDGSG